MHVERFHLGQDSIPIFILGLLRKAETKRVKTVKVKRYRNCSTVAEYVSGAVSLFSYFLNFL